MFAINPNCKMPEHSSKIKPMACDHIPINKNIDDTRAIGTVITRSFKIDSIGDTVCPKVLAVSAAVNLRLINAFK